MFFLTLHYEPNSRSLVQTSKKRPYNNRVIFSKVGGYLLTCNFCTVVFHEICHCYKALFWSKLNNSMSLGKSCYEMLKQVLLYTKICENSYLFQKRIYIKNKKDIYLTYMWSCKHSNATQFKGKRRLENFKNCDNRHYDVIPIDHRSICWYISCPVLVLVAPTLMKIYNFY